MISSNFTNFTKAYATAVFGGLLMVISTFLTWYSFKIVTGLNKVDEEFTLSGLGAVNSSSFVAKTTAEKAAAAGVLVIILAGLLILLAGLGLLLKKKGFAIPALIFSIVAFGFMVLKLVQASNSDSSLITQTAGLGIYLGVLATIIAIAGSVLALTVKRR